jgi:hypothetical protein
MKDYITIIKAIKKSWREKVDFIKTAHTNNDEQKIREYCTLIQGEAVEFGNMLENDGLQWSNIIKKLEVISEVCYQLELIGDVMVHQIIKKDKMDYA